MAAYQPPPDQLGGYLECLDSLFFFYQGGFFFCLFALMLFCLLCTPKLPVEISLCNKLTNNGFVRVTSLLTGKPSTVRDTETFRKQLCLFSLARAWNGVIKTCRVQKAGRARGRSDWKRTMKCQWHFSFSISLWGPGKHRVHLSPGKTWMQKCLWWVLQRCHLKHKQRSGDAYLNLEAWNKKGNGSQVE